MVRTASVQKELRLRGPPVGQGSRVHWILGSRSFEDGSLKQMATPAKEEIVERIAENIEDAIGASHPQTPTFPVDGAFY